MSQKNIMADSNKLEWKKATAAFYPAGVQEKILWEDKKTGATVALVKYPVGTIPKTHTHPKATEVAFIIEGESKGAFGLTRKGSSHGKITEKPLKTETIVLLNWDGPR